MIRTVLYFICSAAAAAFLLLSCAKEEKELTVADQEAAIESYINQNFPNTISSAAEVPTV